MFEESVTDLAEVLAVLATLEWADCPVWVAGGWGVDALVGRQTRLHRDLDLGVDARLLNQAVNTLTNCGYSIETNWLPVRVELYRPETGRVDLHPIAFNAHGDGTQPGLDGTVFHYPQGSFTTGSLNDVVVPCLSRSQQLRFHQGYEHRDNDRHDVALLHALPADTV